MKEKKLYRSCKNKVLGGVCGGLGEYFDIDPVLIRLAVILIAIAGGAGVLFYIIAWVIIPEDPSCENPREGADEIKEHAENIAKEVKKVVKDSKNTPDDSKKLVGSFVILLGLLFLLQNIFSVNLWSSFWPVALIILGFYFMVKSNRK